MIWTKNKFARIFMSFGQISCQLQDTATGISGELT